jgi:hypothetical protein
LVPDQAKLRSIQKTLPTTVIRWLPFSQSPTKAATDLNAKVEEKLREVEWPISAIMAKFNHLGGRRHGALAGTESEKLKAESRFTYNSYFFIKWRKER